MTSCQISLAAMHLPACRRLLFPLLHVTKEIGDVCTQASDARILVVFLALFFFCFPKEI